jgi:uncharacterized surface protein with fasciclin (FAS1) repeats
VRYFWILIALIAGFFSSDVLAQSNDDLMPFAPPSIQLQTEIVRELAEKLDIPVPPTGGTLFAPADVAFADLLLETPVTHIARHEEPVAWQLDAIRRGNFAVALGFASSGIKSQFSASDFELLIRNGYSMMTDHSGYKIHGSNKSLHGTDVYVEMWNVNHPSSWFEYNMTEEQGVWKIQGVSHANRHFIPDLKEPEDRSGLFRGTLLNHLVLEPVLLDPGSDETVRLTALGGLPIKIERRGDRWFANDLPMLRINLEENGGVIHLIDGILGRPIQPKTDPEANLVDALIEDGRFEILISALNATGLNQTIRNAEALTIFAPTDEAFGKLPDGALVDLINDPDTLRSILLYHVIADRVSSDALSDGLVVPALSEQPLKFSVTTFGEFFVNESEIIDFDLETKNGIFHAIDAVLIPETNSLPSLPDLIGSKDNLSFLTTALSVSGLIEELQKDGPFTVFAPDNGAFFSLGLGGIALLNNPEQARNLLLRHVVSGRLTADQLEEGLLTTLSGEQIAIQFDSNGNPTIGEAGVSVADLEASNGIVHIVDSILEEAEENIPENVIEFLEGEGNFTLLLTALREAELVNTLGGLEGTLFAPTDEAFNELPDRVLSELLGDPEQLAFVLKYHVVEGQVFSSQLSDGLTVASLAGPELVFAIDEDMSFFVNESEIVAVDAVAGPAVIHTINQVLVPEIQNKPTILELANSTEDLTLLATAVRIAELSELLESEGPYTVFAPVNTAFTRLGPDLPRLLLNPEELAQILAFHVVEGAITSDQLAAGFVETLGGDLIEIKQFENGSFTVGGAELLATDVEASNGVVHTVDSVLETSEEGDGELNLVEWLEAEERFSILLQAVGVAELGEVLANADNITLFAPTDAAFGRLPEGQLDELIQNPDRLASILQYHILGQKLEASELNTGLLTTLNGVPVLVNSFGAGVRVNTSRVIEADNEVKQGIIHVIDNVLVPPIGIFNSGLTIGTGQGNRLRLGFESQAGRRYQLFGSTDLQSWQSHGQVMLGNGEKMWIEPDMDGIDEPAMFFRLAPTSLE